MKHVQWNHKSGIRLKQNLIKEKFKWIDAKQDNEYNPLSLSLNFSELRKLTPLQLII